MQILKTLAISFCLLSTIALATAFADCTSLANLVIESTTITAVALIPSGGGLPEYCRVQGHVDTEIDFEIRLPTVWNGKFYFGGNPGFAGTIPAYPAISSALGRGYATAVTDTGHQATQNDGSWALNNPERQINFFYRAIHVVTVAAKQIVEAYYGHVPGLSYFQGCSNGGRQALIEAQRYPTDFNGIIAESPVLDQMGALLGYSWKAQAAQMTTVPMGKVSILANAVLQECDAKDGLQDGLISDPRRCRFDPQSLQCAAGDAPDCLTAEQVQAVRMIYAGPVNSAGERLYPEPLKAMRPMAQVEMDGLFGLRAMDRIQHVLSPFKTNSSGFSSLVRTTIR